MVHIKVGYTELLVTGSSDNKIEINSQKELKTKDSRADDLALITPWPDNTGFGIHISEKGNVVSIIKSSVRSDARYVITVPQWVNIRIEESEWGRGNFEVTGINGDIHIESNSSDISLRKIAGSVQAESTSGEIIIEMPTAGKGIKHQISSVSGEIDLQIVRNAAYSFNLSTVSGSIKTDFELIKEIEYKGSTLKRISKSREVETDLNGGGDLIDASTVSGLLKISFVN